MEQFSLEKYLENPSRKVITRDGRVVKILDTEFESGIGNKSVLAKCIYNNKAAVYVYTTDGKANNIGETENDLFFADEEEVLTAFEKAIQNILNEPHYQDIQAVKQWSKTLLDLARDEILKDLPKWEKSYNNPRLSDVVPYLGDYVLYWRGYYIRMKDIEKLPKEE